MAYSLIRNIINTYFMMTGYNIYRFFYNANQGLICNCVTAV